MSKNKITIDCKKVFYKGIELNYFVFTDGTIYNATTKHKMSQCKDKDGYMNVCLSHQGKHWTIHVHRLVANAFIPNPDNKPEVNHKNGKKHDNNVSNLEWSTAKENVQHAYSTGLHDNRATGERHGMNKYSEEQIKYVCQLLESNSYTISEIINLTGVPKSTISDILSKKYWTHISEKYNITNFNTLSIRRLTDDMKKEMIPLIKDGYRKCDILRHFGLETTKTNYGLIKRFYDKIKNEDTSSSTIENIG